MIGFHMCSVEGLIPILIPVVIQLELKTLNTSLLQKTMVSFSKDGMHILKVQVTV